MNVYGNGKHHWPTPKLPRPQWPKMPPPPPPRWPTGNPLSFDTARQPGKMGGELSAQATIRALEMLAKLF